MTQERIRLGIIGLGVMGTELWQVAAGHPDFEVVLAADPYKGDRRDPGEIIGHEGIDAVYIASPPATHAAYAIAAMRAGKAVFCEKPLAVNVDDGMEMVAVAEETGVVNALNFVMSDRSAARAVAHDLAAERAGDVVGVDMRFVFPEWPRPFQREARWVDGLEQGGFLREVVSHYVFLTDRLLGPLEMVDGEVDFGSGSERQASAMLRAGRVPVGLSGQVAAGPETYEWTLYGSERSYRITDWGRLQVGDADGWHTVELPGPRGSEETRLTEFARAVRGRPSTLADFAAGLRVQRIVEGLHGRGR
jgi:predicted dehydrogenase